MDPASAVAGLIGLAALVIDTTIKIRELYRSYSEAQEDISRVLSSLQTLEDLVQESRRLAGDDQIVKSSTLLTRTRSVSKSCNWKHYTDTRQNGQRVIELRKRPKAMDLFGRECDPERRCESQTTVEKDDCSGRETEIWGIGKQSLNTHQCDFCDVGSLEGVFTPCMDQSCKSLLTVLCTVISVQPQI